jgi:hypothetical protein
VYVIATRGNISALSKYNFQSMKWISVQPLQYPIAKVNLCYIGYRILSAAFSVCSLKCKMYMQCQCQCVSASTLLQ